MPPPFKLWPLMVGTIFGSMAFMAMNAILGPALRQLGMADWQAGAMLTLAGLLWMLSSAFWGRASNRYGRKAVLLVGLVGEGLCLLAISLVVYVGISQGLKNALWVSVALFVLRGVLSYFYSSVAVATQSSLADNIEPSLRGEALASLGAAQGIGMILGPAIAGSVARLDLTWAFFLSAAIPLVGAGLVAWFLPTRPVPRPEPGQLALQWTDPRIRLPLATAFVCMFAVMSAQLTVGFLAIDALHLDTKAGAAAAGVALSCVGVALLVAQLIVRKLSWTPVRLIRFGAPIAALGFSVTPFVLPLLPSVITLGAGFFTAAFGLGFVWPAFQAAAANSVKPHEQGEVAGHVSAAQGAATVVSPIIAASLYTMSMYTPYLLSGAILIGLAAFWWRVKTSASSRAS